MALKSTVFKVDLNVADTDRQVYGDFPLTVARHPSETDQRMMLRLLAFALNADERLVFGRGISTAEEPDIWRRDLTGRIELWIDLGTPEPERLRRACSRSEQVILYAYGERATAAWWDKHRAGLTRSGNLAIYRVADAVLVELGALARPGMSLQCTVSGGEAWLGDGQRTVAIQLEQLQ